MKNHKPEWDVYREMRTRSNAKVTQAKVDKKEAVLERLWSSLPRGVNNKGVNNFIRPLSSGT